ncbi:hypothetical protein C8Q80DRAFT_687522 [Daedaleopsis nitida]|nr:hypothetical protein C8Q80DRAFT_687522 [Daedaleopsis nitida]
MSEFVTAHVDAAIAAVQDSTISPHAVSSTILKECRKAVDAAPEGRKVDRDGDTPGLSSFLWSFWSNYFSLIKDDNSSHERFLQILIALKRQKSSGCQGWQIWGEGMDWSDLPLFGPVSREEFNGPFPRTKDGRELSFSNPQGRDILAGASSLDDPDSRAYASIRTGWLNLNTFLARVWALDIQDESLFAMFLMRDNIETLTLTSTTEPMPVSDGNESEPQELKIEAAAAWIRYAGARMFACREIMGPKGNPDWPASHGHPGASGGTWDGVDGYHSDRWAHWKGIFADIADGKWRKNVREAAQAAVEAMNEFERETVSG